uniref:Uncharacterized protein n=1 Tax=Mustela putorius furo TaxID=9669 RepID=M3Z8L4_MUSPF
MGGHDPADRVGSIKLNGGGAGVTEDHNDMLTEPAATWNRPAPAHVGSGVQLSPEGHRGAGCHKAAVWLAGLDAEAPDGHLHGHLEGGIGQAQLVLSRDRDQVQTGAGEGVGGRWLRGLPAHSSLQEPSVDDATAPRQLSTEGDTDIDRGGVWGGGCSQAAHGLHKVHSAVGRGAAQHVGSPQLDVVGTGLKHGEREGLAAASQDWAAIPLGSPAVGDVGAVSDRGLQLQCAVGGKAAAATAPRHLQPLDVLQDIDEDAVLGGAHLVLGRDDDVEGAHRTKGVGDGGAPRDGRAAVAEHPGVAHVAAGLQGRAEAHAGIEGHHRAAGIDTQAPHALLHRDIQACCATAHLVPCVYPDSEGARAVVGVSGRGALKAPTVPQVPQVGGGVAAAHSREKVGLQQLQHAGPIDPDARELHRLLHLHEGRVVGRRDVVGHGDRHQVGTGVRVGECGLGAANTGHILSAKVPGIAVEGWGPSLSHQMGLLPKPHQLPLGPQGHVAHLGLHAHAAEVMGLVHLARQDQCQGERPTPREIVCHRRVPRDGRVGRTVPERPVEDVVCRVPSDMGREPGVGL